METDGKSGFKAQSSIERRQSFLERVLVELFCVLLPRVQLQNCRYPSKRYTNQPPIGVYREGLFTRNFASILLPNRV
jgi:hypothetical protein